MTKSPFLFSLAAAALLASASAGVASAATPRMTPTDVQVIPFCRTEPSQKLDPKTPGIFNELQVTSTDKIHIYGRKHHEAGKIEGKTVFHIGKAALIAPEEWKGTLVAKLGSKEDVRTYGAVIALADKLVSKDIKLDSGKTYTWQVKYEGDDLVLYVLDSSQMILQLKAPKAQVQRIGFAATVRWAKNEADLDVNFDRN